MTHPRMTARFPRRPFAADLVVLLRPSMKDLVKPLSAAQPGDMPRAHPGQATEKGLLPEMGQLIAGNRWRGEANAPTLSHSAHSYSSKNSFRF